jgi:hypothetical protein
MRGYGALVLDTAPSVEPISLTEAKLYLKVDSSADDALITDIIKAARQQIELYLSRALINQTWLYRLDKWPCKYKRDWWDGERDGHINSLISTGDEIEIPKSPLSSVTHLKTYDDADTAYTMPTADYYVDTSGQFGRVVLRIGSSWPTTELRQANGIEIKFVCGYGAAGTNVPSPILIAMRNLIASMYDCRGDGGALSAGMLNMLGPYRVLNQ